MDGNKLEVLLRALETGSLTAAAAELGYTQSGVTHIIHAIEKEMGVPLLNRGRNGVEPTLECEALLPRMRTLLSQEEALRQEAAALRGVTAGEIHIGSNNSIAMYWLPAIAARFEKAFPGVRLHMYGGDSDGMAELLAQGKLELAFLSHRPPAGDWVHLAWDPLIAVLPDEAPWQGRETVSANELSDMPYLRYTTAKEEEIREAREFLRSRGVSPTVKYESNSDYAIVSMVEQGLGVTLLPELILSGFPQKVLRLPVVPGFSRDLGIGLRTLESASPAVRQFILCARQTIASGAVYVPGKRQTQAL